MLRTSSRHFVTRDSDIRAEQRRDALAERVAIFIGEWQTLLDVLRSAQLQRQQSFESTLRRLIADSTTLYGDLSQELDRARTRKRRARELVRNALGHSAGHPLVVFFGREATNLRRHQVIYVTTVVKLMTAIVLYGYCLIALGFVLTADQTCDIQRRQTCHT